MIQLTVLTSHTQFRVSGKYALMRVVVAHNFAAGWPELIIRYWTVYSEHETAAAAATI